MDIDILKQDISDFVKRCTYWEQFRDKRILVTGATGLIGSILTDCLIALEEKYDLGLSIYCVCRNKEKAQKRFDATLPFVHLVSLADLQSIKSDTTSDGLHYIIHTAAPTTSSFFTQMPVETFEGVVSLTKEVLEMSRVFKITSLVYLSSLEMYGEIYDDANLVTESTQGYINPLSARSSYSMGKRAAECLCYAYYSEYNTPVKIARLAQTFGAGVSESDNRVFAYIAKTAMNEGDVVLSTKGDSKKNYCYTIDAVDAIFRILLFGQDGEAYNVGNRQTYISVKEMAELVMKTISPKSSVIVGKGDVSCYPPSSKIKMATDKLENLGWEPHYDLTAMYARLIAWLR